MYFPLIVLLTLTITVSEILCQDNTYEYSDQHPWAFVYTVYPFYNSETLLEVWKTDKAVDISTNTVTLAPNNQDRADFYSDNVTQGNDTNLKTQNNVQYFVNEGKNSNVEQVPKSRQRLSAYRNRHKDSDLQNE